MAGYYIYLIASLPMLHFGAKPPLSSERFLGMCQDLISEEDMAQVESACADDIIDYKGRQETLVKFRDFEIALRNELVRIRASRRHRDPSKYMRQGNETAIPIGHIAINAYRAPSPLEAEKMLDHARWNALDELTAGRYFDMDVLIAYAIKLVMLEKWEEIAANNNSAALEARLAGVRG